MKQQTHIVNIVLTLLIIVGCNTKKSQHKKNIETITVNVEHTKQVKLASIIDNIKIIPLETTNASILGEISTIKTYNDKLYVKASKNIYVFNNNGKFERKIGETGNGPNEILATTGFHINKNGTIEIYDGVKSRITTFDKKGQVISNIKHPYRHGYDYIKSDDKGYFFYLGFLKDKMGELIYTPNLKNKSHKNLLNYDSKLSKYLHFGDLVNFPSNKYGTYFTRSFNDTIYQLTTNNIKPKYHIDFGDKKLPESLLYGNYSDVRDFMMTCLKTKYAFRVIGFFEMENYILFGFHYKNKIANALYNKQNKECIIISSYIDDYFNTNVKFNPCFSLLPKGFNDNYIYIILNSYELTDYLKTLDKQKEKQFLKQIVNPDLKQIKPDDNPIILQIKLK